MPALQQEVLVVRRPRRLAPDDEMWQVVWPDGSDAYDGTATVSTAVNTTGNTTGCFPLPVPSSQQQVWLVRRRRSLAQADETRQAL